LRSHRERTAREGVAGTVYTDPVRASGKSIKRPRNPTLEKEEKRKRREGP